MHYTYAYLPASIWNMQNKWWRRKTLLNDKWPSSKQSKATKVSLETSSLESFLIWHNRITWIASFTCPAIKECKYEDRWSGTENDDQGKQLRNLERVLSSNIIRFLATNNAQPLKESSSSTYLINNSNAALIPLEWNSRSRSALLASMRTCHITFEFRKVSTSL